MEDVICSIQESEQAQEQKQESIDLLDKNNEEFVSDVISTDNEVGELIRQRKEDFYATYSYLRPECERSWLEKLGEGIVPVGEWCREHWDKAMLFMAGINLIVLTDIKFFVEGFAVSALKNILEIPTVFLYPYLIFDKLLLRGRGKSSAYLNFYDNVVESVLMRNRWYAKNVPAFNLGRCAADIVSMVVGIIGTGLGVYTAFLGAIGGAGGTAVGGGAIALPVGAVAVGVGVAIAVVSLPLLAQGAANLERDMDEYWKSRLNESRSSGRSGSGAEGGAGVRGKLTGSLDGLTADERTVVNELLDAGNDVEIIPRSNIPNNQTPDFYVNGVKTELKTLNGTSLNTPLTRIQNGFKQGAEAVIIDARKTGMTSEVAEKIMERALGIYNGELPGTVEIWTTEGIIRR